MDPVAKTRRTFISRKRIEPTEMFEKILLVSKPFSLKSAKIFAFKDPFYSKLVPYLVPEKVKMC